MSKNRHTSFPFESPDGMGIRYQSEEILAHNCNDNYTKKFCSNYEKTVSWHGYNLCANAPPEASIVSPTCSMKCPKWKQHIKIINLTPHAITAGGETFPPSGEIARVETIQVPDGEINNIPVHKQTFGKITGLPEKQRFTVFVVSAIVLAAAKEMGRTDVVAPNTSSPDVVRNEAGHIISVPGFVK